MTTPTTGEAGKWVHLGSHQPSSCGGKAQNGFRIASNLCYGTAPVLSTGVPGSTAPGALQMLNVSQFFSLLLLLNVITLCAPLYQYKTRIYKMIKAFGASQELPRVGTRRKDFWYVKTVHVGQRKQEMVILHLFLPLTISVLQEKILFPHGGLSYSRHVWKEPGLDGAKAPLPLQSEQALQVSDIACPHSTVRPSASLLTSPVNPNVKMCVFIFYRETETF